MGKDDQTFFSGSLEADVQNLKQAQEYASFELLFARLGDRVDAASQDYYVNAAGPRPRTASGTRAASSPKRIQSDFNAMQWTCKDASSMRVYVRANSMQFCILHSASASKRCPARVTLKFRV